LETRAHAPFLCRVVETVVTVVMETARWAIYLIVAFAAFAAMSGLYARYWLLNEDMGAQLLILSGYILWFVGAPLLATVCATLFAIEFWRLAWGRVGFFEENGLRPVDVMLNGALICVALWFAHASLEGRWEKLPVRAAAVLQLPVPEEAQVRPKVLAALAVPGRAGLYRISRTAPRLRAALLGAEQANDMTAARSSAPIP
jgi:hypothetical protein